MKTTLNIENPHHTDQEVYMAAMMEAIGQHPTWEVGQRSKETCSRCGYETSGWNVLYPAADTQDVRRMSTKALLLAGWDGTSGCYGTVDWLVDMAAQLKVEGFMGWQS